MPLRPRPPRPGTRTPRGSVACIQATAAWRDWYDHLRAHVHLCQNDLLAEALREYAVRRGFLEPMPPR
jgi:hypothetical protein